MAATKISVYSITDLKTTLDDHIPIFLTSPNLPATSTPLPKSHRFAETNLLTTIRLAIGYTAVLIALYIFYLDYYLKVPWNEHKGVTFYAVIAYFILNGLLTAWIWYGEKGVVFEGSRKGGSAGKDKGSVAPLQLKLSSFAPKHKFDPVYRLAAEWTLSAKGNVEKGKVDAEAPFTLFFQADGSFVSGEFERWLKKEIPVLAGGADAVAAAPAAAMVGAKPKATPTPAAEEDDVIVVEADNSNNTATPSGRDVGAGSAKKRSKRKA